MATILLVNASPRSEQRSITRMLAKSFLEEWHRLDPTYRLIEHDLRADPPPLISEAWIAAAFRDPNARETADIDVLAYSDRITTDLQSAEIIVIASPMYNYGMPAALKAWFDQVARIGVTFSFNLARGDWPIQPIISGKRLLVLSAHGEFGFQDGGVRQSLNVLHPGIAACAHYLGASAGALRSIAIEYQEFGDERFARSVSSAHEAARSLANQWATSGRETLAD